jgi:hypothetical protein
MMMHGRRMLEQTPVNMARYAAVLHPDDARRRGRARAQGARQGQGSARSLAPRARRRASRASRRRLGHAQFWGAAALQGGGWGIYGDFLGSLAKPLRRRLRLHLAGPMVQSAQNFGDATIGEGCRAARRKTHPGRDVVKLLKQETPGSSLWYTRLAFERLVADQLQEEIDPGHKQGVAAI